MKTNRITALRILTIVSVYVTVALAAFCASWWYRATRAETLSSITVPQWLTPTVCRLYGVKQEERLTFQPDGTAYLVSYSIAIHKSQIKPWGTLWCRAVSMRLNEKGQWEWAGEANFPQWR
jgi:hypothetical protein